MHLDVVEVVAAVVVGVEVVAAVVGEVAAGALTSQLRILTRNWTATTPMLTPCKLRYGASITCELTRRTNHVYYVSVSRHQNSCFPVVVSCRLYDCTINRSFDECFLIP